MGHVLSSKEGMKLAMKGFMILLIVTLVEVAIALLGNGHIGGMHWPKMLMIPVMCILSLYKAYYIVSIFMHLGSETKGMAASIVLPVALLFWAIIAFLWEGDTWNSRRNGVKSDASKVGQSIQQDNMIQNINELPNEIRWS
ncbi:MAG: cytochrome C oxidase subunit IV family protein [Saprospiraceae bacterium]|nr:cytochrome C oxidase subunit IV family protein [Saprospiraceae bacterium]